MIGQTIRECKMHRRWPADFPAYDEPPIGPLARIYLFLQRVVHRFVKWGVEVVNAVDADGKLKSKVLRNNWTNSPERQALICPTFPKD